MEAVSSGLGIRSGKRVTVMLVPITALCFLPLTTVCAQAFAPATLEGGTSVEGL